MGNRLCASSGQFGRTAPQNLEEEKTLEAEALYFSLFSGN